MTSAPEPASQQLADAIEQARREMARSRRLIADSETILAGKDLMASRRTLARRCAWCDRYALADHWLARDDLPQFVRVEQHDVTHGICPRCLESVWP